METEQEGYKLKRLLIIVAIILVIGVTLVGCKTTPDKDIIPQSSDKEVQNEILSKGQSVEPVYQVENFLARNAINRWSKRMDDPSKVWYVYEFSETGSVLRYYISSTVPLSYGVSLTSPMMPFEGIIHLDGGGDSSVAYVEDLVLPAPGVDGVFYAGVDEDLYFFFDAETDALVMTNNRLSFSDKPIALYADAPRIVFETSE